MSKRLTYVPLSLCVLLFTFVNTAAAQDQKIGYVDTDLVLSNMPAYQGIQQQLQSISAEWKNELELMEQEIERLKEDFNAKEILYTDEMREQKQQEIQQKINERQQFLEQKFGAEGEFFQQQKQLLEPIQREVINAINVVAERQNFDFIFDRAQNTGIIFSTEAWNLNDEVLQELGITLNGSSN